MLLRETRKSKNWLWPERVERRQREFRWRKNSVNRGHRISSLSATCIWGPRPWRQTQPWHGAHSSPSWSIWTPCITRSQYCRRSHETFLISLSSVFSSIYVFTALCPFLKTCFMLHTFMHSWFSHSVMKYLTKATKGGMAGGWRDG